MALEGLDADLQLPQGVTMYSWIRRVMSSIFDLLSGAESYSMAIYSYSIS